MKTLLLICAALLFVGIANLPIGYYTFLRIIVSISAVYVVASEYQNEITSWIIAFGIIAIIFNPIIPIYLHDKSLWKIIDFAAGILFVVKALSLKPKEE